jgi:hypothetical protein
MRNKYVFHQVLAVGNGIDAYKDFIVATIRKNSKN